MGKVAILLRISGGEVETVALELAEVIEDELGVRPTRSPDMDARAVAKGTKIDPWAVAAVLLAIPQTILAIDQIAERIERSRQLRRLIDWAGEKQRQTPEIKIMLIFPDGKALPLKHANPAAILDAIGKKKKAARKKR